MSSHDNYPDPDDMFADTRMTFGEHIEDLRVHLIRAILGFLVALFVSFFISPWVLHIISKPVEEQLGEYWRRYNKSREKEILENLQKGGTQGRPIYTRLRISLRELRNALKMPGDQQIDFAHAFKDILRKLEVDDLLDWNKVPTSSYLELNAEIADPLPFALEIFKYHQLVRPPTLTTLSVQEAFVVYFKVSLMTGFVLGSPWIFYQIWAFIAAGLYPHEKKYVNIFLPFSVFLFLGGVLVCEFFVMARAIEALLWFNEWLGFAPDLRLNEWLGFAIFMPLVFGISFQTPLAMLFAQRVGVLTVDMYRGKRRIAWFLLAVFAAVITPSTDPISMMLLWIPMSLLYELGIAMCLFLPGKPLLDLSLPEPEDHFEV